MNSSFHQILRIEIKSFCHLIYSITKCFPKEEVYGLVSQIRRAAVSILLNYIEGYARVKTRVNVNFLEIA